MSGNWGVGKIGNSSFGPLACGGKSVSGEGGGAGLGGEAGERVGEAAPKVNSSRRTQRQPLRQPLWQTHVRKPVRKEFQTCLQKPFYVTPVVERNTQNNL